MARSVSGGTGRVNVENRARRFVVTVLTGGMFHWTSIGVSAMLADMNNAGLPAALAQWRGALGAEHVLTEGAALAG
ncbi:MAG: hypothetical protein O3B24_06295, partial [Verrucomicrobia bacterium]|nr:hypothetical protein [Verrucomicrobiota bacterium]